MKTQGSQRDQQHVDLGSVSAAENVNKSMDSKQT